MENPNPTSPNSATTWRKRLLIACGCVLIIGTLVWMVHTRPEPTYSGKPLSWWLLQTTNATRGTLFKELCANTNNALPDLIRLLRTEDWPHREKVEHWVRSHHFLDSAIKFGPSAELNKDRALVILAELGVPPQAAKPQVLSLLTNQSFRHKQVVIRALMAMDFSDHELAPFLPVMIKIASDSKQGGGIVAARILLNTTSKLTSSEKLRTANELLKSADPLIRRAASDALRQLQPAPSEAEPEWGLETQVQN